LYGCRDPGFSPGWAFCGGLLLLARTLLPTYWLFKKADRPVVRLGIRVAARALAVLLPCAAFSGYYNGPSLSLPLLLALPWMWRSRRIRPILPILAGCLAVNVTETWIFPHCLAPEAPLMWIIVIESMILVAAKRPNWGRSVVAAKLVAAPGRHLALVKYLPGHVVHDEWVYNQPDIDSSRIVWARDLGPG
jgi:hypothetical protein